MKNLLNREEYLQMNEGFRDSVMKGFNKVKSFFKLGIKKIKNFIAVFDNDGDIMPVVTPHALVDHFADVDGINVFANDDINDVVKNAGGKECGTEASCSESDEYYSYCPKFSTRKEMVEWFRGKKYESSKDYNNFLDMFSNKKNEGIDLEDGDSLNESSAAEQFKSRISYSEDDELDGIKEYSTERFKEVIRKRLREYSENVHPGRRKPGNILVFGAPGIGKSTIPRMMCDEFNKGKDEKDRACLITVDAQNIQPGDFLMPKMPSDKDIFGEIEGNDKSFDYGTLAKSFKANDSQVELVSRMKKWMSSNKADMVPQQWLPAYKPSGDDNIDFILDNLANGGIHTSLEEKSVKTGSGGILFFDEYLRADEMIFHQLMNLFTRSRTVNGWKLGSKWAILACTNRPADSDRVREVWSALRKDSALIDRFPEIILLKPEPESWRRWAKDNLKADELILDFIFDEKSADTKTGEYPRWHSIVEADADATQVHPITPRRWEEAIIELNYYMDDNGYDSISEMDKTEILECLDAFFDEDFVDVFATWIEDNISNIKIDEIIKDPKVKMKKNENTDDVLIIRDIWSQVKDAYKDGREFTDDEIANIMLFLCRNFPKRGNIIDTDFIQFLDILVPSNYVLETFQKTLRIYNTAFLSKNIKKMIETNEDGAGEYFDYEEMKKICKEYFPYNLDEDGEIKITNEWDVD